MIKKIVGKRIKQLRNMLALSQEELAECSNVHRTYIASLEVGKRNVSIVVLDKIITSLGVSWQEFFSCEE